MSLFVEDEADQLLDLTYLEDMRQIVKHAGKKLLGGRKTIIVSTTVTLKTLYVVKLYNWCKENITISQKSRNNVTYM